MKKLLWISLGLAFSSSTSAGQTCKYQDVDGHIIYANVPIRDAKKLMCFGSDNATPNAPSGDHPRSILPTPPNFPRVDASTQKQRDNKRLQILGEELGNEKKALEQAKQAYAEGESNPEIYRAKDGKTMRNMGKYTEKMQSLQSNIDLHEKNIQLLEKELSSLK